MTGEQWFIQLDGDELGPLSSTEFRDLAGRGVVTANTPVSLNRAAWQRAANVPGLFVSSKCSPLSEQTSTPCSEEPSGTRSSDPQDLEDCQTAWGKFARWLLSLVAGGLLILLLAVVRRLLLFSWDFIVGLFQG